MKMTNYVHHFGRGKGGTFRISLTCATDTGTGSRTDPFHGSFAQFTRDELVVQSVGFEKEDPLLLGTVTIHYRLCEVDGGTEVTGIHEDLPLGLSPEDSRLGWQMSRSRLAGLVERRD